MERSPQGNLLPEDQIKELERQLKDKDKALDSLKKSLQTSVKRVEELEAYNKEIDQKNDEATDRLKSKKILGNAVSGDVFLNEMELEIIDTPEFQRLNEIKQLGSTNLVYRSAVHTRFDHSIGVLKMADVIINKIRSNYHSDDSQKKITSEEEQIIRLVALLHDICHMPYGHTFEDEFRLFSSHDKTDTRWKYYLGEQSAIGKIITKYWGKEFHNEFYRIITSKNIAVELPEKAFIYEIVNDTICADLLDYLKRDIAFTNLSLESSYRILNFAYIHADGARKNIGFRIFKSNKSSKTLKEYRKDSLSDLTQLLKNRYYLGERVYFHHTKILYGTILAGALLRVKKSIGFSNVDDAEFNELFVIQTFGDGELLTVLKQLDFFVDLIELQDINEELKKELKKESWEKLDQRIEKIKYQIRKYGIGTPLKISNKQLLFGAKKLIEGFLKRDKTWVELKCYGWEQLGVIIDVNKINNSNYPSVENILNIHKNADLRLELEERICSFIPKMSSGDFLIYIPSNKMSLKPAEVKVPDNNNPSKLKPLIDIDHIPTIEKYKSIAKDHYNLFEVKIFVNRNFLPVDTKSITDQIEKLQHAAQTSSEKNAVEELKSLEQQLDLLENDNMLKTYYRDLFENYADHIILSGDDSEKAHLEFIEKLIALDAKRNHYDPILANAFAHDFVKSPQHSSGYDLGKILAEFAKFKAKHGGDKS